MYRWHILANDEKKCTVKFEMYCGWLNGICSAQLFYHKDVRSGCLNQHCVRNRKSLTECRIQRREHCPIYQGIMKHATHCKILIVLKLLLPFLCIIRKSNYLEATTLKWFGKKKHSTFWFWHHGRRSVSHEIILALKCFFLKILVQLECCIFS